MYESCLSFIRTSSLVFTQMKAMKLLYGLVLVFLSIIVVPPTQSQSSTNTTTTTTCPIDFSYVHRVPFNFSSCKNFQGPPKTPETDVFKFQCCSTLYLVFGLGGTQLIKKTSLFLFPNLNTSINCFQNYQSIITSLSLPSNLVSYCFDSVVQNYVTNSNGCAKIQSSQDFLSKLNQTPQLESLETACKPDLTNRSYCDTCMTASVSAQSYLNNLDGNVSHYTSCWNFVILYAAGVVNEPGSNGSASCLFGLTLSSTSQTGFPKKRRSAVLVIAIVSAIAGVLLIVLVSYLVWRKILARKRLTAHSWIMRDSSAADGENDTELPLFSLRSLLVATDNFSEANKLGEGGFGPVYKGILAKNQEVAIKRLSTRSGQGQHEFLNEVKLIAKLQHTNLVRLLGCCIEEEEMILVYEYMHNRSLDHILFDSSENKRLDWGRRSRIIDGIAQGVLYIHKYSRLKIIHRDLKASNVLLDEEMDAKISDFGMAKIFEKNQIEANTNRVVGTYGYMSPEYASYGHFSEKSDVFSFGVLLLEILSGKRNAAFYRFDHPVTLVGWAWKLWKEGSKMNVIDESVRETCPPQEAIKCIHIAFLCVQEDPVDRPTMATVIQMLGNDTTSLPSFKEPAFSSHVSFSDVGSAPSSSAFSTNSLTMSIPRGR